MSISKSIFSLGGAIYDVIKHCTEDVRKQYINLGWSVILCTIIALISGADITHQYTESIYITIAGSVLFATLVFSFDYFIINSTSKSWFVKPVRILVAIANICLSTSALFVLLNQSKIDTKFKLENAGKLIRSDTTYQNAKKQRYAALYEQISERNQYHNSVCLPEANKGYADKMYFKKHAYCLSQDSIIRGERAQLDTAEVPFNTTYKLERESIKAINNKDFFQSGSVLIDILKENWFTIFIAVCFFVLAFYVECQSLIMKFSLDENDEYHINLRKYKADRKGLVASKMDNDSSTEKEKILLNKKIADEEITKQRFEADMNAADAKALRELEIKGKIEILRKKGYNATANDLEEIWKEYINNSPTSDDATSNIFKMSQSMAHQVEEIKKTSTKENVAENIFSWIVTNISYDIAHSKEHYRTAKETYNEKRGLCGELSVLYLAFLRAININCSFCEVMKDNIGKEVTHACIIIKNDGGVTHLSDAAYKSFNIEHLEYRELTDAELKLKYDNWNQ